VIVAFLGPSLPAAEARAIANCKLLPPARQGDVWRALALRPRAIALIDGVFESQPSVWHHEILDALDAGLPVLGGASMGALRAAELHRRGMVGVGRIFRWYRDGEIEDDAEVALLHAGAEHGYAPLTVPLVNVRWAAEQAGRARILSGPQARRLVERSGRIFYQERTWPRVLEALPAAARARWDRWGAPDLKAEDAREVLRAASKAVGVAPAPRRPAPSSLVRRRRLEQEVAVRRLARRRDAQQLAEAGLRRALLAGKAREHGLRPLPEELRAAEARWRRALGVGVGNRASLCARTGLTEADVLRFCEELALERLVLDHAPRLLNDGPSAGEALAAEARLRGLWKK
jgi:hypothetical protein